MTIVTNLNNCKKDIAIGSLVTVEIDKSCIIQGEIGEITKDAFYVWQNKEAGFMGKLDPEKESNGKYLYSWMFRFDQEPLLITIINKYKFKEFTHPLTRLNLKHKIMNNIVNFAKNLTLSKEEKLLRKYGLKDECGNYTKEARRIIAMKLCSDNENYLVEIATEKDKETKK